MNTFKIRFKEFFLLWRDYSFIYACYNILWWVCFYTRPPYCNNISTFAINKKTKWLDKYFAKKYNHIIEKYHNVAISGDVITEPKIWVFWGQGEDKMPPLVEACYRQLTHYNENINLEMQVSSIDEYEYKRFQLYGANMLSSQIEKGESYHNLQKSFQIIFCTGKLNFDSLWTMYTSKDSSNNNEPYNLIHRVYVNMPYIDKIIETKGRENLSNFEKIILIFQYGIKNGIIMYKGEAINMMDDPIVRAMEEKMNEVTNDKALRAYAFSREMGRMQHLHQQETLKKQEEMIKSEKEMIKSEKEEIKLEKEEIKTKQEKLDLKKEELNSKETELNSKETELNSKQNEIELREQNMLKFISKQYNCSLEEAKEILKNM